MADTIGVWRILMGGIGLGLGVRVSPPSSGGLGTLTLSGTLQTGVSSSGVIYGSTSGSTITTSTTGLTVNSVARTYTFDGSAAGGTSISLTETKSGVTGSPKVTVIGTVAAAGDSTAPTLSSPTGTQTGTTTGTSTVSTNEANGTLYAYLSTSSSPPTATNLKSGSGAVTSASQAVSGTGVQTVNWTGLSAGTTYYTHWLHRDAAGNDSSIVSGTGFTTAHTAFVASRTYWPNKISTSATKGMFVTEHKKLGASGAIQPVWVAGATIIPTETAAAAPLTITASLEYPVGTTPQPMTFGGLSSGTAANTIGQYLIADAIGNIPVGATFVIRCFVSSSSASIPYSDRPKLYGSDKSFISSSATDLTLSGTPTDDGANRGYFPVAILGSSTAKCAAIISDSRGSGVGDITASAPYSTGEIAPTLTANGVAHTNLSVPGDWAAGFVTSNTWRRAIIALGNPDVIFLGYGINDLSGQGRTATQLKASWATMRGYFTGKKIVQWTIAPKSNSTDGWTTTVNQTNASATVDGHRKTVNADLRTGIAGVDAYIDLTTIDESSFESGLWPADGVTTGKYTTDGLHGTTFTYDAIRTSGIVWTASSAFFS